jgi:hypothetical protein
VLDPSGMDTLGVCDAAVPFEGMVEVGWLIMDAGGCLKKRRVLKTWMQSWRLTVQKPCKFSEVEIVISISSPSRRAHC